MRYIDAEKCLKDNATLAIDWIDLLEDEILTPTADVRENVKGEWIAISDEIGDFRIMNRRWIKCNQCNEQMMIRLDAPLPNFCPYCGAEMRTCENE